MFDFVEALVGNQYRFTLYDGLNFFQAVHNKGTARTYNIKNPISQANSGGNLNTPPQFFDLHINAFNAEVLFENFRIAGGNAFPVKIIQVGIHFILGNSERKPTVAESQLFNFIHVFFFFPHFVFSQDTDVCNAIFNVLRNIIVT